MPNDLLLHMLLLLPCCVGAGSGSCGMGVALATRLAMIFGGPTRNCAASASSAYPAYWWQLFQVK